MPRRTTPATTALAAAVGRVTRNRSVPGLVAGRVLGLLAAPALALDAVAAAVRLGDLGEAARCARDAVLVPVACVRDPAFIDMYARRMRTSAREVRSTTEGSGRAALEPRSEQELAAVVRAHDRVAVVGAGYSQGSQYIPSGAPRSCCVSLRHLDEVRVDPARRTAECGAGVTVERLQAAAARHGLAVQVAQASPVFTLAGGFAVGAHGYSLSGNIGTTVLEARVMLEDGEVRVARPGDELFSLVLGGLGNFGVVTRLVVRLVPNLRYRERAVACSVASFVDECERSRPGDDTLAILRLPLDLADGRAGAYVHRWVPMDGEPVREELPDRAETEGGSAVQRYGLRYMAVSGVIRRLFGAMQRGEANSNRALTRCEVMRPPIRASRQTANHGEFLAEFFLPPREAAGFADALYAALRANDVRLINCSMRFVRQDRLSSFTCSAAGDRVSVVLFWSQWKGEAALARCRSWVSGLYDEALRRGGSFYPVYADFYTRRQLHAWFPAREFLARHRGKFCSRWTERYLLDPGTVGAAEWRAADPDAARGFCAAVFRQLRAAPFVEGAGRLARRGADAGWTRREFYERLSRLAARSAPGFLVPHQLRALALEREAVTSAVPLEGLPRGALVEIGTGGRFLGLAGGWTTRRRVLAEAPATLANRVQWGLAPGAFEWDPTFGDYRPLEERDVALLLLPIGLHHCPPARLDAFLRSVRDCLVPGGLFVLREHDCEPALASLVHQIFNAGTGVPADAELHEVRNFWPCAHWVREVRRVAGLEPVGEPSARADDPSRNTVLVFRRPHAAGAAPARHRDVTLGTVAEWYNVESAQRLASLDDNLSLAYFAQLLRDARGMWSAARLAGWPADACFLAASNSLDAALRLALSLPLWPLARLLAPRPGRYRRKYLAEYGRSLERVPAYNFPYLARLGEHLRGLARAPAARDVLELPLVAGELLVRALWSLPIRLAYRGAEGDDRTIDAEERDGSVTTLPRYAAFHQAMARRAAAGDPMPARVAGQSSIVVILLDNLLDEEPGRVRLHGSYAAPDGAEHHVYEVPLDRLAGVLRRHPVHRVMDY